MLCISAEGASISKLALVPQGLQYESIMATEFHQIIDVNQKPLPNTKCGFCQWSILCDDERIFLP